ncbi:MAG: redoxin domain-containing protein [Nitrospinota bacterium]
MSSDTETLLPRTGEPSARKASRRERRLLRLFVFVPLVFLLALGGYAYLTRVAPTQTPPLRAGDEAPLFAFPDLKGRTVSLKDFRGKVVFLNVWATWCPTCVWEMPSMEVIYQKYRNRGLVMLAVSIDALGKDVVVPFMKKYELTFPALLDPKGTIKRLYQTTGVPETFIIDREGRLFRKVIGPREWTRPEMTELIEIALRSS